MKSVNFGNRHRFISAINDLNIKGSGVLANTLAHLLLPKSKGKVIMKTLHGFKLVINPVLDSGVERRVYFTGTYEKGILHLMGQLLRRGDRFVDVGSNIGLMTIHAGQLVGPEGHVYAYEANPKTVEILKRNIDLNELNNIKIIPKALANETGRGKIYANMEYNRGSASLAQYSKKDEYFEIDIIKFENAAESEHQIRLVKIDIEGYELEALKGFGNVLNRSDAPMLIIECTRDRTAKYSAEELFEFLTQTHSYQIFKLSGSKERISTLLQVELVDDLPDHDNIVALQDHHLSSIDPKLFG